MKIILLFTLAIATRAVKVKHSLYKSSLIGKIYLNVSDLSDCDSPNPFTHRCLDLNDFIPEK
jgi:hypothetical protein